MVGIGGGHPTEPYATEMRNHGTQPRDRYRILRERVLAMREIWTKEEAEFHGEFVDFGPIWAWPKPVQQPHPPIFFGSNGRTPASWARTLQRLLEFCDGWMVPSMEPDLNAKIAELQGKAHDLGRARLEVTLFGVGPTQVLDDEAVERYHAAGVDRIIFTLPPSTAETAIPELQRVGRLAARYEKS